MALQDSVSEGPVRTMSSRYYCDPEIHALEKEKIFYRTWQFVGHLSALPEPGAFLTARIADESLIVVRGQDDQVRAFYNVCRHRAHQVTEGRGQCRDHQQHDAARRALEGAQETFHFSPPARPDGGPWGGTS